MKGGAPGGKPGGGGPPGKGIPGISAEVELGFRAITKPQHILS